VENNNIINNNKHNVYHIIVIVMFSARPVAMYLATDYTFTVTRMRCVWCRDVSIRGQDNKGKSLLLPPIKKAATTSFSDWRCMKSLGFLVYKRVVFVLY